MDLLAPLQSAVLQCFNPAKLGIMVFVCVWWVVPGMLLFTNRQCSTIPGHALHKKRLQSQISTITLLSNKEQRTHLVPDLELKVNVVKLRALALLPKTLSKTNI